MVAKQIQGIYAPDGSWYGTVTDGEGNLVSVTTTPSTPKQIQGVYAPDGSRYMCLTDGAGNLV